MILSVHVYFESIKSLRGIIMRGINECFINDLKVGCLEGLLKAVKQDDTLR